MQLVRSSSSSSSNIGGNSISHYHRKQHDTQGLVSLHDSPLRHCGGKPSSSSADRSAGKQSICHKEPPPSPTRYWTLWFPTSRTRIYIRTPCHTHSMPSHNTSNTHAGRKTTRRRKSFPRSEWPSTAPAWGGCSPSRSYRRLATATTPEAAAAAEVGKRERRPPPR